MGQRTIRDGGVRWLTVWGGGMGQLTIRDGGVRWLTVMGWRDGSAYHQGGLQSQGGGVGQLNQGMGWRSGAANHQGRRNGIANHRGWRSGSAYTQGWRSTAGQLTFRDGGVRQLTHNCFFSLQR